MPAWESKYPAFKWCADKNKNGTGRWYFPSPTEMQELFALRIDENGSSISLSEYLKKMGGVSFAESDDKGWSAYWASSELFGGTSANSATFTESNGVSYDKKTVHKVRAIKYIQIYPHMAPNRETLENIKKGNVDEFSSIYYNMVENVMEYNFTHPTQLGATTKMDFVRLL